MMRKSSKATKEEERQQCEAQLHELVSKEDPELIYELTQILGKGSHGVVYMAINRVDGSFAAVKKLPSILQSENLAGSLREIKILKEVSSPYCIEYYNSYLKAGDLWIAMEFFDAGSIGDLLAARKKGFSEPQVQMIVYQVLRGLEYLHNLNLIHRDIKTGNVLLNKLGRVKLADFGISAFINADETRRQTQIGSPFWMSPELILGEGYTTKTDIWSLGITILEMAEYDHPFFDQNPLTAVFQIVSEQPPIVKNVDQWSANFIDFMKQCLTKDSQKRPSAKDLLSHPFVCIDSICGTPLLGSSNSSIHVDALTANTDDKESSANQNGKESSEKNKAEIPSLEKELHKGSRKEEPVTGNSEEEILRSNNISLAQEFLDIKKTEPQRENCISDDEVETIVRIYMQDRSYKSMLIKAEDTAEDVSIRLRGKIDGKTDSTSQYALFKFQNENERLVPPETRLFDVMKQNKNGHFVWIFKENPDTEAFGELVEVYGQLRAGSVSFINNYKATSQLVHLLLQPRLTLASALCSIVPKDSKSKDKLAKSLIQFYGHHNKLVELFLKLGANEVARTVSANNLFVEGGITAKLIFHFGKLIAKDYLQYILQPVLNHVFLLSEPLELDPSRADQAQIEGNSRQLQTLAEQILDAIRESIDIIPLTFRAICSKLQDIVSACFPSCTQSYLVLRSFLFTKIICPAIVFPDIFGLADTHTCGQGTKRTLVLLSKTIASLVTDTKPGQREPYMSIMNSFIESNRSNEEMQNMLKAILDFTETKPWVPKKRQATSCQGNFVPSPVHSQVRRHNKSRRESIGGFRTSTNLSRDLVEAELKRQEEQEKKQRKEQKEKAEGNDEQPCEKEDNRRLDETERKRMKKKGIVLSEEELEKVLKTIWEFFDDDDKFRLLGIAMNVLPSPPWETDNISAKNEEGILDSSGSSLHMASNNSLINSPRRRRANPKESSTSKVIMASSNYNGASEHHSKALGSSRRTSFFRRRGKD